MKKILPVFLFYLLGFTVMAIEKPSYTVVETYDHFEVRRYDPYIVAETVINAEFDEAGNQAFRILFDYISGANQPNQKIKMTAPVEQSTEDDEGQKIKMTAPVVQEPSDKQTDTYVVGFVMPSKYTMETIPEPKDPRVTLRETGEKLMAAHKYSGRWSEKRYRKHELILLESLEKAGFEVAGNPVYARYDPPFMPWFMRRNEVLIKILPKNATSGVPPQSKKTD